MRTRADRAVFPISLAVAAVLLLAPASLAGQEMDAELYGDLRYSYNRADDGTDARWASANDASRLGVRGEVAGETVTAFFHLETGVSVDAESDAQAFTQRFFYGGLRGDFGTVTVGRHTTAYKAAGLRADPLYYTSRSDENWTQAGPADDAVRLHGSYRGGDRWTVSASYEHVTSAAGDGQDYLYAAGTVDITTALTAAVSAGDVSSGDVSSVAGTGVNTGLWYTLFPRTRVYGLYSRLEPDQGDRRHLLSVGLAQGFSLEP